MPDAECGHVRTVHDCSEVVLQSTEVQIVSHVHDLLVTVNSGIQGETLQISACTCFSAGVGGTNSACRCKGVLNDIKGIVDLDK